MKKEIHFPTILGLLILITGSVAGVFLLRSNTNQRSQASGNCAPANVQVTNITYQSVDISFITSSKCSALLTINNKTLGDIRSTSLAQNYSSSTHYFQIDSLSANTQYSFTIASGDQAYDNAAYKLKTSVKPSSSIPASNLAWGKIYNSDHTPASSAIIYLNIPGGTLLSSYVTANGNWNISLANSFNESKTNWFTPPASGDEEITVFSENNSPLVLTGNTSRNNPVSDIILGQTTGLDTAQVTPSIAINSFTTVVQPQSYKTLKINSPREDEYISSKNPMFLGEATPGTTVSLQLTSATDKDETTIVADQSGNWQWSLLKEITSGQKTLIATAGSESVNRKFYISASISGPAFVSSPSATIAVTLIPTVIDTPIPTIFSSPTQNPTPTIYTRSSMPSTDSGTPTTGISFPTITITFLGILTAFIGLLLFR